MKTQTKLRISFGKESDTNLDLIAAYIIICMTDNPDFPNPIPTLAEVVAALTAFRTALEDAKTKASASIAKKNQARRVLLGLLRDLGLYIMSLAKGNTVILSECGYPFAKTPGPRTISSPGHVYLTPGNSSGKMEASVKPEKPSPTFLFQISSIDPASGEEIVWQSFVSTVSKFVFTGLEPGKRYWVRAASGGARGQQIFGPVSSEFAL